MGAPILPGRLGDPAMSLRTDPRADPRLVEAVVPIGLADHTPPTPVSADAPIEDLVAFVDEVEAGFLALFESLAGGGARRDDVERRVEVIRGVDGNDITLFVHRPAGASGLLPGVLHLHGGGMVELEAAALAYDVLRDELAGEGLVVVGVEFRNGAGKHGPFPFPAGLHDCASALAWMDANRSSLGVSTITVAGESGGGNLSLATTLKAARDGSQAVDGVYAMCPYISGAYDDPPAALTSLVENDGYFLDGPQMAVMVRVYDPERAHRTDPLAWPYHASVDELRAFPPTTISVNQLDPLRDEGLAFARKLWEAGVPTVSRTVNGTCHAGDLLFPAALPDVHAATIRDLVGFCRSVARRGGA